MKLTVPGEVRVVFHEAELTGRLCRGARPAPGSQRVATTSARVMTSPSSTASAKSMPPTTIPYTV
jgi:hypothetical protein